MLHFWLGNRRMTKSDCIYTRNNRLRNHLFSMVFFFACHFKAIRRFIELFESNESICDRFYSQFFLCVLIFCFWDPFHLARFQCETITIRFHSKCHLVHFMTKPNRMPSILYCCFSSLSMFVFALSCYFSCKKRLYFHFLFGIYLTRRYCSFIRISNWHRSLIFLVFLFIWIVVPFPFWSFAQVECVTECQR